MNNQPPQPPSGLDREREIEEQHLREQHIMRQQQEEMAQRNREHEERERQRREQQQYQSVPQHQNNTGTIPIHQPVASRLPGAIHSPGGLLANHNGSSQPGPLGAPTGPGNAFGGPLHGEANRSIQPHNQQQNAATQQQHQIFGPNIINHVVGPAAPIGVNPAAAPGFGGPLQPEAAARSMQQMPFGGPGGAAHPAQGAPALGQGQQPILNVSFLCCKQRQLSVPHSIAFRCLRGAVAASLRPSVMTLNAQTLSRFMWDTVDITTTADTDNIFFRTR